MIVPAAVIAGRQEAKGATGPLRSEEPTAKEELGKQLFIQNCKSCHTLAAVQAHGVTGPNLDELGGLDKERVLNAIETAAPAPAACLPALLEGEDADAVATYVADVAGR